MGEERIVRAAVGRIANIGDLYDARSDDFCRISILKKTPPVTAIRITDNSFSDTQFIHTDMYSDKFDKLNIKAELKVSVLAGLFSLEGHGKYLRDEKKSARAVRSSLLYNIQTRVEQLNLFSEDLRDCFSIDALNVEKATHVVVEVAWGANSMVTMEYSNTEDGNIKEIHGALEAQLKKLKFSISGKAEVDYASGEQKNDKSFSLRIFADVLPVNEDIPQTFDEALSLMKKMPRLVQSANEGKGKPLQYALVPLSVLEKYLNVAQIADRFIKQLDEQSIIRFVQIFDDISIVKQQLNDLYSDMNSHRFCVQNEDIKKIGETKTELEAAEANLRSNLAKTLVEVRSGKAGASQLEVIRSDFENGDFSLEKVRDIINSFHNVVEKIKFADILAKEGVAYIGLGSSIETEQIKNSTGDIYVLFFGNKLKQSNQQLWSSNRHQFLSLIRESNKDSVDGQMMTNQTKRTTFIAVDCDVRPEVAVSEGVKNGICICRYKNGKYISFDVLLERVTLESLCLARSTQFDPLASKPNKRVALELRCPGSVSGECEIEKHNWVCAKCNEIFEYDFNGFFYCKCGRAVDTSFEFKCNSNKHGLDYIKFSEQTLKAFLKDIKPMKELNILILGETGVGKSTWINGLVNYVTYPSLEVAEQSEQLSLIAASFTMTDDNFEERVITTGKDDNENHVTGQSATQEPKAYVFQWGDTSVRLIDTPGIGDTRGIEQDKKNFDAILRYLNYLDELNGICILLKPNNARLTAMFRFCIKELLTHLHRSASENIVFCFTNARSTFYRPGDTLPALKKLLADNKDVEIALTKYTLYCMDNESFRFLCAMHYGIKFNDDDRKNYSASWDKSVAETNRMFQHIASLKPHVVKETISLNDARKVIVILTKPLADICQNIQDNMAVIRDKKKEILNSKSSAKDLESQLKISQISLVPVPLGYPRTVCTKCVNYSTIEGRTQIEYTSHCHEHCGLSGVQPESFPNAELKNCSAMNSFLNCTHCGCSWDKHMHMTYEHKRELIQVTDKSIESQINSKMSSA